MDFSPAPAVVNQLSPSLPPPVERWVNFALNQLKMLPLLAPLRGSGTTAGMTSGDMSGSCTSVAGCSARADILALPSSVNPRGCRLPPPGARTAHLSARSPSRNYRRWRRLHETEDPTEDTFSVCGYFRATSLWSAEHFDFMFNLSSRSHSPLA